MCNVQYHERQDEKQSSWGDGDSQESQKRGKHKRKPNLPVFLCIGSPMHGLLCWSVVVGWSVRSVGVAVAQIEVNIVIILLVLVVGAVHVRVVARVLLLWSRIRGVMVIIVVVVVAVVASRLSHGGGNGLWGRGSGSPRGRIIVVEVVEEIVLEVLGFGHLGSQTGASQISRSRRRRKE